MDSSRLSPGWEWASCPDKYTKALETIAKGLVVISQNDYSGIDELKKAIELLVDEKMQHKFFIEWSAVDYDRHEEIMCREFIDRIILKKK